MSRSSDVIELGCDLHELGDEAFAQRRQRCGSLGRLMERDQASGLGGVDEE